MEKINLEMRARERERERGKKNDEELRRWLELK